MVRATSLVLIAAFSGAVVACTGGGPVASAGGSGGIGGASKTNGTAAGGTAGSNAVVGTGGKGVGNDAGAPIGADAGMATGGASADASGEAHGAASGDAATAVSDGNYPRPDLRGSGGLAGTAGSDIDGGTSSGAGGLVPSGTGGRLVSGTGGAVATGTGGRVSSGTGGSIATNAPKILWTDSIQSHVAPWGLSGFGTEHPIGTSVTPSDSNGANFSVVPDPMGGAGFAIRHFATFDTGGSRSQGGLYGDVNTIFGKQAKSPEGVWVAQEWYLPEAISANGDDYCWINLWDFHSIDADRGNRWHTSPGLMLARDGSMKVRWEWGGPAGNINQFSPYTTVALPVGRWFDIEMHYVWADTPSATITLWIDGQQVLEQRGVQTRAASHQIVETYLKFYGSTQGRGPWAPTPSLKYTRNVRVAGERIWR